MTEAKNKIQIPKDWKWEKLEDALDFVIGGDWGKDENFEDSNYGLAYCIRGSEIKNWENEKGQTASLRKIKLSNIEKRKLQEGDILVEISGGGPEQPVGRTVLIDKTVLRYEPQTPKICTNFLRLIRPKKYVEGKFLNLYLKLFYYSGEIVKYQGGSNNLRNLKFPDYVKINFPLPPKPTQQAIVSKIEELFSELDKGIETLRLAQQQLKTYRQSVLKWAFEGRLTNEIVKEGELPEGWRWMQSGDFFDFVTSGSRGWAKYYADQGAIFIRITNLDFDSLELDLNLKKIQYVNPPLTSEGIRTKVQEGDFLFSITGYLGMLAIAPKLENAFVNQHVCLCRPKNNFNKRYLGYWIISKSGGHHYLNKNQKGAVKAGLNLDDLKSFPVPLCTVEEQNKIVKEIESRLSVSDKMEECINESLQQAEALRQSILKKAFEGRLIPINENSRN